MLSRGTSDASTRLRRSKSSASVNRRRKEPLVKETVDPETAHRDAMTAAQIAMDRANERASAEMRRSADLSRNQSNASRPGVGATPRSQNIRFTDTVEPRRQRSTLQSKTTPVASSVYMPGSNSYTQLPNVGKGPPLNEFGLADGYGSTPSSYRRLRKTKSMLTPRKRGSSVQDLSSQSPGTPRTLRHVKSSVGDHDHGLRLGLKRSMSFLKLSSGNLSRTFKRSHSTCEHNDAAVDRAREQFMQDVEDQRLRKRPSFLSAPKIRHRKAFRKSVRSNRTTDYGDGVSSEHQQTKQESKLRSFSASLRDRVKRVLKRSTSKDNNLPAQHLDASRPHFRDYVNGTESNVSQEEYMVDNHQSGSRGSIYVPSSHKEESLEDLEAISRSLRSMHSSDSLRSNGRSRVTSWTNSTMTNSLPGRGTPIERKRLSIIQEHGGPHQPSSSIGRHMDEVSATHLPLTARHGNEQLNSPIDSQRVYSALMKRIDQEQEEQNRCKTPRAGALQESRPKYTSSAHSFQTAPTIRQVTSEDSLHTIAPDDHHRQFSLQAPSWHAMEGKTPQEIVQENESLDKRKSRIAPQEDQSSFFPFSSEKKPPTTSPFKLALAARREQQTSSDEENGSVVITRPSQGDTGFETSSESQYSRTTSGQLPMVGMNRSDPEIGDEPTGMATIIPNRMNRYPRPSPSLAQLHKARSNASVEWKSWISTQMTDIDRRNSRSSTAHYREGAQIDGDDVAVGGRIGSAAGLGRRLSARTASDDETPAHDRRSSTMNDRFPLLELKEVPRNNTPKPRSSSSITRLATPSAADVKRGSLAAVGVVPNDENTRMPSIGSAGSNLLRAKYSQAPFPRGEEPVSTPGKLQPQHQTQGKKLGRPQSLMTIRNQYGKVAETPDRDEKEDDMRCVNTMSRLIEPFIDGGYPGGGSGASRVSLAPSSRYMGEENEERDTALPRIGGSAEKRRAHKIAIGIPTNSKRMVSNFLRSRRRNAEAREHVEAEEDACPAFV
jgi:hypothetical protein